MRDAGISRRFEGVHERGITHTGRSDSVISVSDQNDRDYQY